MYESVEYRMADDGWHCPLRAKCRIRCWRRKENVCVCGLTLFFMTAAAGATVHGDCGLPKSLLFGCCVVKGTANLLLIKLWVIVLYI